MPTLVKTPTGSWKAVIRRNGRPTMAKTFLNNSQMFKWRRQFLAAKAAAA
jgi:hypothetical protein